VGTRLEPEPGQRFGVVPSDARTTLRPAGGGEPLLLDRAQPPGPRAPVRLHAAAGRSAPVHLSDEERRRLEALGYAQ
jgi:hypothetical protein